MGIGRFEGFVLLFGLLAASASAQDIKPFQAQSVQPVRPAQSIEPYRAQDVQPARPAQEVQLVRPTQNVQPAPIQQDQRNFRTERQTTRQQAQASGSLAAYLGTWQTNIPGVAYTTPSGRPGYDILHVSSGAAGGLLVLNRNGTYKWNSYGGKTGKWVETGRSADPIEIIDTVENRRWGVRMDSNTGEIILQSGSIYYYGRRAAVK
jgi:hypothetical protein